MLEPALSLFAGRAGYRTNKSQINKCIYSIRLCTGVYLCFSIFRVHFYFFCNSWVFKATIFAFKGSSISTSPVTLYTQAYLSKWK